MLTYAIMGKSLGHKITLLLANRRMTRKALAEGLEVYPSTVGRWADDKQSPTVADALRLARYFDVPLDWLADPEQDYPPPSGPATPLGPPLDLTKLASNQPHGQDQPARDRTGGPARRRRQP